MDGIILNAKVKKVESQLAEKAKQTDVNTALGLKRDKSVPINELDISDSLKQQMTGNSPVLQTIADKIISPRKTSFIKSLNLFDKLSVSSGYLNGTNGTITADASYSTSDFMKVTPNATLYASQTIGGYAFYDANMVFISATIGVSVTQITVASNAYYIRVYCTNSRVDQMMVFENATVPAVYTPYNPLIDINYMGVLTRDKLGNILITPENLTFASSKNLFDKSKANIDRYVNNLDGTLATNTSYYASDVIPIAPNTQYTRSDDKFTAFYDQNLVFISGHYDATGNTKTITTPANAKYMRCSLLKANIDTFQIEKGSIQTGFESYSYKIDSQYIRGIESFVDSTLIKLPPVIPALIGREINIYFDNVILCNNINDYQIDVVCTIGNQQNERWTCIPNAAGTYSLTINIYKDGVNLVATATSNVVVKASSVGNGVNKKCIFIGDSTTAAGTYTQELLNIQTADVMKLTLLGSLGTTPNFHEGRSGWATYQYVNSASLSGVTNPFFNNATFDFSYYMAQKGYATPDYVNIHLGINDVFTYADDSSLNAEITNIIARFNTMINSIKAFNTNIKIGLMIAIPPSKNQDAFGKDYGSGQNRWRYRRNNFLLVSQIIENFKNKEAQGIYLVPINVNLDTVNNMATENVAVNSRNATTTTRQSNGVHPATSGYNQMADVIWSWLKSFEV